MEAEAFRFLIVEDEATSAAILKAVVGKFGSTVLAGTAEEALAALGRFTPDTILLDISLPDGNGHALLHRIRQMPQLRDVPVIFVTASGTADDQIRGLDEGASDYIVKPVEPNVLHARLRLHVQRLAQERQIRHLADHDDLTGLANRRRFMEVLGLEVERAHRYDRPLALLAFDLDHFKGINDRHGHDTGDRVLQAVGEVLQKRLRHVDHSGRLGGEEFGVVLPETGADGAHCVADKLRCDIADIVVENGQDRITPTASFGFAVLDARDDLDSLRRRADEALYASKAAGRNRVTAG